MTTVPYLRAFAAGELSLGQLADELQERSFSLGDEGPRDAR